MIGISSSRCALPIEHRGPDSRGLFLDDGVGLGIQRLRVIDLETGDQPIFNEDGSVVVVLNGEIYNYRELREELARRGHRFATQSDTEVIVHLYEEHGAAASSTCAACSRSRSGTPAERQLLLARDRVGKKPLFYAQERRHALVRVGGEGRSSRIPRSPREVDLDAIDASSSSSTCRIR